MPYSPAVISSFLIVGALVVAAVAARSVTRRRAVLVLGPRGPALAPALLASFWLTGIWLGQFTGSLVGMALVGALPLVALAVHARRRFPLLRVRPRIWTRIDLAIFVFVAVVVLMIDLYDNDCHRAVVGQYLRGNIPPTALNDPRFPLAYHSLYDAVVALVVRAFPLQLETAMDVVTIGCVALTLANLGVVTRYLFRSSWVRQVGRVLFVVGFGPAVIRMFLDHEDLVAVHGRSTQAFIDVILRRPTALAFVVTTLAMALLLPYYRRGPGLPLVRAARRAWFLLPAVALLPNLAEELALFVVILAGPLFVMRRLPWRLMGIAALVWLAASTQSGVVRGIVGHASMAAPHLGIAWPPRLPTWYHPDDGMPVFSWDTFRFLTLELGPLFLLTWILALVGRDGRRRVVAMTFLGGLLVAAFLRMDGWVKGDGDRFLFYGTAPVFLMSAGLIEILADRRGRLGRFLDRAWLRCGYLVFAVLMCVPSMAYPIWTGLPFLESAFNNAGFGNNLRRNLSTVGPRDGVITTLDRGGELVTAGFVVVAPMTGSLIGVIERDHFDEYTRAHAEVARWLFLPQNDRRVAGQEVQGRDGDYVLVRTSTPRR